MQFEKDILKINCKNICKDIEKFIREQTYSIFKKKGAVVGLSGGIDSSVTMALCLRSLGRDNVLGIILPEEESSSFSLICAKNLAKKLRIKIEIKDITSILDAFGVYKIREGVLRSVFPKFSNKRYKFRIIMPPDFLSSRQLNIPYLEIRYNKKIVFFEPISGRNYLKIIAATNIKQRIRMTMLYYYAESNNYVVAGTTNMTEYLLGFYVKYGDGGVDIEPISHLYKTQIYQLAHYLNIPRGIIARMPTPDTYTYPASDEDMYFRLSYKILDILLYAYLNNISPKKIKSVLNISHDGIKRIFTDFRSKFRIGENLRKVSKIMGHFTRM